MDNVDSPANLEKSVTAALAHCPALQVNKNVAASVLMCRPIVPTVGLAVTLVPQVKCAPMVRALCPVHKANPIATVHVPISKQTLVIVELAATSVSRVRVVLEESVVVPSDRQIAAVPVKISVMTPNTAENADKPAHPVRSVAKETVAPLDAPGAAP